MPWTHDEHQAYLHDELGRQVARFTATEGGWLLTGSELIAGWTERAVAIGLVSDLEKVRHVRLCDHCDGEVERVGQTYVHAGTVEIVYSLQVRDDIVVRP